MNGPIADARERIVATAQTLFARFGLRKTTLDEIVHRANVAKGTFYRYFSNKEVLFREVIERESEMMMSLINRAVGEAATPGDKMAAYVKARMSGVSQLGNLYEVTRESASEHWPRCEGIRERHLLEEQRIVRGILEDGVSQGVFASRTPDLAAAAIVMAARGLESSWILEANSLEAEQGAEMLLGVLFQGIMRR